MATCVPQCLQIKRVDWEKTEVGNQSSVGHSTIVIQRVCAEFSQTPVQQTPILPNLSPGCSMGQKYIIAGSHQADAQDINSSIYALCLVVSSGFNNTANTSMGGLRPSICARLHRFSRAIPMQGYTNIRSAQKNMRYMNRVRPTPYWLERSKLRRIFSRSSRPSW